MLTFSCDPTGVGGFAFAFFHSGIVSSAKNFCTWLAKKRLFCKSKKSIFHSEVSIKKVFVFKSSHPMIGESSGGSKTEATASFLQLGALQRLSWQVT